MERERKMLNVRHFIATLHYIWYLKHISEDAEVITVAVDVHSIEDILPLLNIFN